MKFPVNPINIGGLELLPLVEGGKGISASNGISAGSWAKYGGIGTFSGVNADFYDDNGKLVEQKYHGKTRSERHKELIEMGIKGALTQAKKARDICGKKGMINMNVLWEMGGCEAVLEGVLSQAKGIINGITCGAGMPYRLSEIASKYKVYYYPIVSSARAFTILWKRMYHKFSDYLGAVVYEDPWLAGGHNGLSNKEDPKIKQDPYPRIKEIREALKKIGMGSIPIIMAGGVWCLSEWERFISDKDLQPIAFQFGTRPLLTQESPIPDAWKQKLLTIKKGDVFLNRFSPTGFYSSAVSNDFLDDLKKRSERQLPYEKEITENYNTQFEYGEKIKRSVFLTKNDYQKAILWQKMGYLSVIKTPDNTIIFVTKENANQIQIDQQNCMGCLSACKFSNWSERDGTTGMMKDPRSFCIQKTLQDISHGGNINNNLMFAGHNAYRFSTDPLYKNGHIPTVSELIYALMHGR